MFSYVFLIDFPMIVQDAQLMAYAEGSGATKNNRFLSETRGNPGKSGFGVWEGSGGPFLL